MSFTWSANPMATWRDSIWAKTCNCSIKKTSGIWSSIWPLHSRHRVRTWCYRIWLMHPTDYRPLVRVQPLSLMSYSKLREVIKMILLSWNVFKTSIQRLSSAQHRTSKSLCRTLSGDPYKRKVFSCIEMSNAFELILRTWLTKSRLRQKSKWCKKVWYHFTWRMIW